MCCRFVGRSIDIGDAGQMDGGHGSTRGGSDPVLELLLAGELDRGADVGNSRADDGLAGAGARGGIIGGARLLP